MAKIQIDINTKVDDTSVKTLKQQLREATNQAQSFGVALAEATKDGSNASKQEIDALTKKFEEARDSAAKLKDDIGDVNEQINILASGSKFEKISSNLGDVGTKIKNLDFEGAAQSAKNLATLSKSITLGEATKSLKDLGSTFLSLGKALLTNPLFLIATVITGIVLAVGKALEKLGVLKMITEAVGKVFEYFIDQLTEAVALVTDFFGWTSKAERELAKELENTAKKTEALATKTKNRNEELVQGFDNEIRLAELSGQSTENAERRKVLALRETAKIRSEADKVAFDAAVAKGDLDKKELADLKEKARLSRLAYNQSVEDIKFFEASVLKEKDDARVKDAKSQDEANKAAKLKRDAYNADRLSAARLIQDLNNSLLTEGIDKELAIEKTKNDRLIEDTLKNTKLIQEEKNRLVALYTTQGVENEKAIRDKYRKIEEDAVIAANNFKKEQDREFQATLDDIIQENYNATLSEQERELQAVNDKYFALEEAAAGNAEALKEIEISKKNAINDINLKAAQDEAAIEEAKTQKAKDEAEKKKQLAEQYATATFDFLTNIASLFADGNEKEQKKAFDINKAASISKASIDTFTAANGAYASLASIPVVGPVLGGIAAAAAIAAGIANVKKIASTQFKSSGASAGSSTPSASVATATPATSSFSLFGQGNQSNSVGSNQAISANQQIQVGISVEEITNTQNKILKYKEMAAIGG